MKIIILSLLIITSSMSSYADCTSVYQKAIIKKQNKTKRVNAMIIASGAAVGLSVLAIPGFGIYAVPYTVGAGAALGAHLGTNWRDKNTYDFVYDSIKSAKYNDISRELCLKVMPDKSACDQSYVNSSDVDKKIAKIILEANMNDELCPLKRGKLRPMKYASFVRYIKSKL